MIDAPAWLDNAPCRGHLNLYFGTWHERPPSRERREAAARQICGACPHMAECRQYARTYRLHGMWGGETEEQRARAGHGHGTYSGGAYKAHVRARKAPRVCECGQPARGARGPAVCAVCASHPTKENA